MPCLQPTVCTGPEKDGPTCEVCFLAEKVAHYQRSLALILEHHAKPIISVTPPN